MARDALKSQCCCNTHPPPSFFGVVSQKKYKEPPPSLRFPRTQCARAAHQLGFISEWSKNGNSYIGKCAPGPSNQQRTCTVVCFFFSFFPRIPPPPFLALYRALSSEAEKWNKQKKLRTRELSDYLRDDDKKI